MEKNENEKLKNFNEQTVQSLSLEALSKTHMENYPDGTPVGGIYHYTLIQRILEMLDKRSISYQVKEIFAANNKFRRSPGVTILPEVEAREGVGSLQSHILRRVFCNINLLNDYSDGEICYNLAVSYTQLGICVGFGPHVFACQNQCICSAEQIVSNYTLRGNERLSTLDRQTDTVLRLINENIEHAEERYLRNQKDLEMLKKSHLTSNNILEFLGMLLAERCRCSSPNPIVHANRTAPLTTAQINDFCMTLLSKEGFIQQSVYDLYQQGTFYLKPHDVPFENISVQSFSLFNMLTKYVNEIYGR